LWNIRKRNNLAVPGVIFSLEISATMCPTAVGTWSDQMSWISGKGRDSAVYMESFELLDIWKVRITAVPGVIRCHGYLER
jgi:hypothetical protein